LTQRITSLCIVIFFPFSLIIIGSAKGFKSLYNRVQKNYGGAVAAIFAITSAIATPFICIGFVAASWAALVYFLDTRR
jgi:hypothetical protein